ncbi:MAG: DedA family protein [Longimicrobiales bacterium]|nr:DedA family protein [Longimicrobiales bacterium]
MDPESAAASFFTALAWLEGLHPALLYLVLAFGAFLENLFPPVPADSVVVVGGVLAAQGVIPVWGAALAVGGANVGGAWLIYLAGRRHGHAFFTDGPGRHILTRRQLDRVERWHARHGVVALFLVRFLPALRAVAPAFAGIGRLPARSVIGPLVGVSIVWYGGLLAGGYAMGQNLESLALWLAQVNRVLEIVAIVVVIVTFWWWRWSRRG